MGRGDKNDWRVLNVTATPDVGLRLQELRERNGLSLRALADKSGVSPNTVSLIERGLSSPSIDTLQRLAVGLGVPITAFFETGEPPARLVVTRSSDRKQGKSPGMAIEHLASGLANHAIASFLITMEPGTRTEPVQHPGVEWVYCLEGLIAYEVEGEAYPLATGDNLVFDATLPHRWHNPGPEPAQMLLVLDAGEVYSVTVEQHL